MHISPDSFSLLDVFENEAGDVTVTMTFPVKGVEWEAAFRCNKKNMKSKLYYGLLNRTKYVSNLLRKRSEENLNNSELSPVFMNAK